MAPTDQPNIEVEPLESLSGEPVSVRATGLRPASKVTVSIERTDDAGVTWESHAQFVAGDDGTVDPATNVTNDDPVMTAKIALAHLNELPNYYTLLDEMEEKGEAMLEQ